jgi:hypothetical protein
MAPKPKKANKIPAGERPKQLSPLAKAVKSAARGGVGVAGPSYKSEYLTAGEAAVRASRIRKQEAKAKAMAKSGKASTSYSPSEMSKPAQGKVRERAMKKQLAKYGESKTEYGYKLNSGKPKRSAKAGSSTVSKVVGRAKTTARELRDIPTAVGTAVSGRNVGYGGGKFAKKDLKTQIKEVGSAIKSGKKGTEAAQVRFGGQKKGTVGAGSLDRNVSKKKAPRK